MSVTFNFLEDDIELLQLLPLVVEFSLQTNTPLWKNLGEITATFLSPNQNIVILLKEDGVVKGYACGFFISSVEFMISQAFSRHPSYTLEAYKIFEDKIASLGATKLLMLTQSEPRAFKKFGFEFERYLLTKPLRRDENVIR